jgi:hypothetical protein
MPTCTIRSASALQRALVLPALILACVAGCQSNDDTGSDDGVTTARAALTTAPRISVQDGGAIPTTGLSEWRKQMQDMPTPRAGCFEATFPAASWVEKPCDPPLQLPLPNRRTAQPGTVGNGVDDIASVNGTLTSVTGIFPTVTNVTSESEGSTANEYSLQMNTGLFLTARCNQAPGGGPNCKGWEQFFYSSRAYRGIAIQSWLIDYGPHCPANWTGYGGSNCYTTSGATSVPGSPISITNLSSFQLAGKAVPNGNDTVTLAVGTTIYSNSTPDLKLFLAGAWNQAEFNVLADFGTAPVTATFNNNATIGVEMLFVGTPSTVPTCAIGGITNETNNLCLVPGSCSGYLLGSTPVLSFTESNATPPCP